MRKRKFEKILAMVAVLTAIIAGVLGFVWEAGGLEHDLAFLIPDGYEAQAEGEGLFILTNPETEGPCGYISIGSAEGYGGEMVMAVRILMQASRRPLMPYRRRPLRAVMGIISSVLAML